MCIRDRSACMLYVYSNLTLGNAKASGRGLEIIRECLRKEMEAPTSERNTAYCVFAGYMGTVLLHLSKEAVSYTHLDVYKRQQQ